MIEDMQLRKRQYSAESVNHFVVTTKFIYNMVDIHLTPVAPTSCGRMMREVRSIER